MDAAGTDVPVLQGQARRGGSEFTVRLPDGSQATVRTPDGTAHGRPPASLPVRLDPVGCVLLAGPGGLCS